jgi:ABC-2 type transport system permease protein
MSATTKSQQPQSSPTIAGTALPLRAEIGRQLRRRRTIGIFIVLIVLPLVLLLAFWLGNDGSDSGERGFVDLAQESGANLVIFTLFASTSFLLIVIVALFAGDTVPSEASWASLRYLLAAPVRRERLLRQKLVVAALSSVVALVFLPAWTLVVGGIAYAWGPYVGPTGSQMAGPSSRCGCRSSRHSLLELSVVGAFASSGELPMHPAPRSAARCC